MDWKSGSMRSVSYGQIPQVYHTYAYYTEGYAIMNEFQVGLAESTCSAIFTEVSENQQLDIVDLGKIALERSSTGRALMRHTDNELLNSHFEIYLLQH